MTDNGDGWMLLYMLLITAIVCIVCFFVLSNIANKGKFGKNSIFNVESSVPITRTEGTGDFESLVGQQGVTINDLRPVGQARIGNTVVEVMSANGFIEAGNKVKVIKVEGNVVTVQAVKK